MAAMDAEYRKRAGAEPGRRLRRRGLLKSAAAAGGVYGLAALAACGSTRKPGSSAQKSGSASQQPRHGGAVTVSYNFQRGYDPHTGQAQDSGIMGLFYETLLRYNPKTWDVEPGIAAKWEAPSQTELIFTLAPNVKWHDK